MGPDLTWACAEIVKNRRNGSGSDATEKKTPAKNNHAVVADMSGDEES